MDNIPAVKNVVKNDVKILIISPTAGFANRMRALSSLLAYENINKTNTN